jgi:hypothetical protein
MNRDSTDNRDTPVQNLRDEQYSHANNQQVENSRLNQINTVVNVIDKGTKTSMTPTPLYILFFLFQSLLYTVLAKIIRTNYFLSILYSFSLYIRDILM